MDWIAPTVRESIGVELPVQDMMQLWRSSFSPRCACFGFDVTQQIAHECLQLQTCDGKNNLPACISKFSGWSGAITVYHGTLEFKMLNTILV